MQQRTGTPIQTNQFKSEFSMGSFHFERFHMLWLRADEFGFETKQAKTNYSKTATIIPYLSVLKQIYLNLRPIVFLKIREDIDFYFQEIEKELQAWLNKSNQGMRNKREVELPIDLIDMLEEVHTELWELNQKCGLGINVVRDITEKERILNAK